jgi:hypothetical protein
MGKTLNKLFHIIYIYILLLKLYYKDDLDLHRIIFKNDVASKIFIRSKSNGDILHLIIILKIASILK